MSSKATEHTHRTERIETTASHNLDSLQHHKHIVCSQIDPHLSHTSYNKSKLKLRHSTTTTSPASIDGVAEGGANTIISDPSENGLNCKSNVNFVNNNLANHNVHSGSSSVRHHNHQHSNQHLHHHQVTSKSTSAHSSPKLSMSALKNSLAITQVESPTSCEIIHMHHTDQLHHQPQTTISGASISSYISKPMLSMSSSTPGSAVQQQSTSGGSRFRHKDPAIISMAMAAGTNVGIGIGSGTGLSTSGISVSSGLNSSGILERTDYATSSFTTNIDALTNAIRNKIIVEEDEEDILSCKSASHPY